MFAGVWGLWQVAGLLPQTREAITHPHNNKRGGMGVMASGWAFASDTRSHTAPP